MAETDGLRHVDRRGLLRGALMAGGALLAAPLLDACSTGASSTDATSTAVAFPDYVPAIKAQPDLPGSAAGVQDAFKKPVAAPYASVSGTIGSGKPVRALLPTYSPPPPAADGNAMLQALNKRANIVYTPEVTPAADYPAKFGAVTAGNTLPDVVVIPLFMNLPRLPDLLRARFADLSDHLSGSKVRDYPNLAGIPTYSWRTARIRGRIFGVPNPRPLPTAPLIARGDLLRRTGAQIPTKADDFLSFCKSVTDAKQGRWALGSDTTYIFNLPFFAQVFGAPNGWRADAGGALVRNYETDEYVQAIDFLRSLRAAGCFHPDAGTVDLAKTKDQFAAGAVLMCQVGGPPGVSAMYSSYAKATPGLDIDLVAPFGAAGGHARAYSDIGNFSITAIAKADDDRVKELLRVLNFAAAPFGSQENLLIAYGVEGVDSTKDGRGAPVLTDRGTSESGIATYYLSGGAPVLNNYAYPAVVDKIYAWEQKVVPDLIADPTVGLYSDTQAKQGSQLTKTVEDTARDCIAGRADLNGFKAAVTAWRRNGGDKIRAELQTALAAK